MFCNGNCVSAGCPTGQHFDGRECGCVPNQPTQSGCGNRCFGCSSCNQTTGKCEPDPAKCPGQTCCVQSGQCVSTTCTGDQTFDPQTCQCTSPQSGCGHPCPPCQTCNSAGNCVPQECPGGQTCCGGTCKACGPGQTLDPHTCQCIGCQPPCGAGAHCCSHSATCVTCGPGERFDQNSCRCVSLCGFPCDPCHMCDPETRTCVPNPAKCPTGKTCCLGAGFRTVCCPGTTCPTCKPGEFFNPDTCKCEKRGGVRRAA